jgi:homoaconitase/3-isopropylmalate dehydratase large subunit
MGVGGLGYLASPGVVAASALLGYMAGPDTLGIEWDPERFDASV